MWSRLPKKNKNEYKRLILAFASLTEMFAQKSENNEAEDEEAKNVNETPAPIVNSKFQETVFQKAFCASAEDIGNTSYDAAIKQPNPDGTETKYLVGIKTFGISSGAQKIAQFKSNNEEWTCLVDQMKQNADRLSETDKTVQNINQVNADIYLELAKKVSGIRNKRIKSSEENLRGFSIDKDKDIVETVYHVLMPSPKDTKPTITVGETSYTPIDIDNLQVEGCTGKKNPTNFTFTDGIHTYKYTPADCQLYMNFDNQNIGLETWDVIFAQDAYRFFYDIADEVYGKDASFDFSKDMSSITINIASDTSTAKVTTSYSWLLTNKNGEVEKYSGFNGFYGVGSKLATGSRKRRIAKIKEKYENSLSPEIMNAIITELSRFLLEPSGKEEEKDNKVKIREGLCNLINQLENDALKSDIYKLIYRPMEEMYINIPNAKRFHAENPDFFGNNVAKLKDGSNSLALSPEQRTFNLVFEPSGNKIKSYITQDFGKAIQSISNQAILGNWILKGVFQLNDYEQLTTKKLDEIGINGIRLYRTDKDNDIHLKFIWIDKDNLPEDYWS